MADRLVGAPILLGEKMYDTREHFNNRLNNIGRKHKAMTRGYVTQMRSDGLIVVKPRQRGIDFPVKGVVLLLLGFFFFKAFLLAAIGPDTYGERIDKLQDGTFIEQGGAWVMQVEPVTQVIADYLGPIMRY
jgi:hypothetical protein